MVTKKKIAGLNLDEMMQAWYSAGTQMSSLEAKGLWFEMLLIMARAKPKGLLVGGGGRPLDAKALSLLVRAPASAVKGGLEELEKNGVFGRLPQSGTIYCREMYGAYEEKRYVARVRSEAGRLGARERWGEDGKKLGKSKLKCIAREEIFKVWNEQKVITHRVMTDQLSRAINGRLTHYKTLEIIAGIKNYAFILHSPEFFWTYKWTLKDFLFRGLDKFLDLEVAKQNYLRRRRTDARSEQEQERAEKDADDLMPDA